MSNSKIFVLMAVFNGADFIIEQLKSIYSQSLNNLHIIIRDDNSVDNSELLIERFRIENDLRNITYIKNTTDTNGHIENFSALCNLALQSDGDYFCFSDQDDIWLKDKLLKLKARVDKHEHLYGKAQPFLVHSDLEVVDDNLKEIAPSFIQYQGLPNPKEHTVPRFLYQNVVTGCSTMFNRALLEIAAPLPKNIVVHDWWFALCAHYFGRLDYIDEPLIKYRQHIENAIGAKSQEEHSSFKNKHIYVAMYNFPKELSKSIEQAKSLLVLNNQRQFSVKDTNLVELEKFSSIKEYSAIKRMKLAKIAINNDNSSVETWYYRLVFFLVKWV